MAARRRTNQIEKNVVVTHEVIVKKHVTSIPVSVTTLLRRVKEYCEAQDVMRAANGQPRLDKVLFDTPHFVEQESSKLRERLEYKDEDAEQQRRVRNRAAADLAAIEAARVHAPLVSRLDGTTLTPDEVQMTGRITTRFKELFVGSYAHRCIEFHENCFVEAVPIEKNDGMAAYYAAQMIRLIASVINLVVFGKTRELPIFMYTRSEYGGAIGRKEHLLSGRIDEVSCSFDHSPVRMFDYKTTANTKRAPSIGDKLQVNIYAHMFRQFPLFPARHVNMLLCNADEAKGLSADRRMLNKEHMGKIRAALQDFVKIVTVHAGGIDERGRRKLAFELVGCLKVLLERETLTFSLAAMCAVMCVRVFIKELSEGNKLQVEGFIVKLDRSVFENPLHESYDGVIARIHKDEYDTTMYDRRDITQPEYLESIIADALAFEDHHRAPTVGSSNNCFSCEYQKKCAFNAARQVEKQARVSDGES